MEINSTIFGLGKKISRKYEILHRRDDGSLRFRDFLASYQKSDYSKSESNKKYMLFVMRPELQNALRKIGRIEGYTLQDNNEIEISESNILIEGATTVRFVNAYERNPLARKKCLEYYGATCCVCGFDFEKTYGELGKGYIQVHHLVPLSTIQVSYIIDPIKDLRPVCPNCHAMIHRDRSKILSIEELKQSMQ